MQPITLTSLSQTKLFLICTIATTLTACSNFKGTAYEIAENDSQIFNSPLREKKAAPLTYKNNAKNNTDTKSSSEPAVILKSPPQFSNIEAKLKPETVILPILPNKSVSRLAYNNMSISTFINEVFGNQLNLSYVIEPSIKNASDLVTMRITDEISSNDLYVLAVETIKSYGIIPSLNDEGKSLVFSFSESASNGEIPLLVSGKALPEIPDSTRPIFHIHGLSSVTPPLVKGWLTQMFPRKELEIKDDPSRNALVFVGPKRVVEQAVAAAELLDRPTMVGMNSKILSPSLGNVTELSDALEKILKTEGFSVRKGDGLAAIKLLPLESVGQLIIFARSADVLNHAINWAKTLEADQHNSVDEGLFSYQVNSTPAIHIVQILNSLGVANYQSTSSSNAQNNVSVPPSNSRTDRKGQYAVDEQLNTILYRGSGKDWLQVLPVIKKLDKPAPSVMIEVILAEVTLNDTEETGIEWLASSTIGKYDLEFSTFGSGLVTNVIKNAVNTTVDNASQTRAIINAFYSNTKANVRSRPRLMVKSGGEASINVGERIPILTQTSQSTNDSNAALVQTVNYVDTGVILSIKPIVHTSGFVDIEINQELSSATGGGLTPRISNRKINTTVTLKDGGSVLLGGLISSTTSRGQQGVPVLGRIPLIGKLFNNDSDTQDRTELMVMIIPYVLNSPVEAEKLTDELQKKRIESVSSEIIIN